MARPERHVIAHLLRRAGFGASVGDVEEYTALGFEGAVDRLINYDRVDDSDTESALQQMRAAAPTSTNDKHPEYGNPQLEVGLWFARMMLTKRPMQEKMMSTTSSPLRFPVTPRKVLGSVSCWAGRKIKVGSPF